MPIETARRSLRRWMQPTRSLSAKLTVLLAATMALTLVTLAVVTARLHRRHLEAATLAAAERTSEIIVRGTSYSMLRNNRDGIHRTLLAIGSQSGTHIRIINPNGRVAFSTDAREVGTPINLKAEGCTTCHSVAGPPLAGTADHFRILRQNGERFVGIVKPVRNEASCSNAVCHAHPASQTVLGMVDTRFSLAQADADIADSTSKIMLWTACALALILALTVAFLWWFVERPVQMLKAGTERLARGELGYQIPVSTVDELGELAASFNGMSRQLRDAREEITGWTHTLEKRMEAKTNELRRVHEQVVHVEKMASIGKMAAVVAHEINNPLSGILTYAKLMRKWIVNAPIKESRRTEMLSSLELIASESRRCGEIVKNLLTFARVAPMNLQWVQVNGVIEQCAKLVEHQCELKGIELHKQIDLLLPKMHGDPAQIEQLLLALVVNAIEAMPHGGNLWLGAGQQDASISLSVRDDGIGIPPDLLPYIFEPFRTTKEGHSAGLGLAVSSSIVERHHGRIKVDSEPGRGTTFTILLPLDANVPATATAAALAVAR